MEPALLSPTVSAMARSCVTALRPLAPDAVIKQTTVEGTFPVFAHTHTHTQLRRQQQLLRRLAVRQRRQAARQVPLPLRQRFPEIMLAAPQICAQW